MFATDSLKGKVNLIHFKVQLFHQMEWQNVSVVLLLVKPKLENTV